MGGFEFGNVQELNSRITLVTFIAVVAFVVFFDFLVGLMEYFLSGSQLYNRMIQLIYKELMLMGLVSFTIIMAEALQKNSEAHNPMYEKWIEGIEFSHILIFYLTFFFVFHAFYLMRTSVVCSRKYRQRFCEQPKHLIDKIESQSEQERLLFEMTYMPFQDLRTRVEFQLIHHLFNETYLLSEGFNFASYLSGCFDRYALKTINRSMFTWFILMILSILNYGRIIAGFGFHNCKGPPEEAAVSGGHRLLEGSTTNDASHDAYYHSEASSDPEAEVLVSTVCPTMNVKLFVFTAILLVVYTMILVLVSRLYKLRLINRIGFKGPQDYVKFMKFAEENKLSNHERMSSAELKKEIEAVMDADEYQSEEESEFKEIGEAVKLVFDTVYDVINNFILDTKIFFLGLIKPSRVMAVKPDSSILTRKTDIKTDNSNNKSSSGTHHPESGKGQLSHFRSTLANTSSHFHNTSGHFDHHRSSSATDDTVMTRSNKSVAPNHNTSPVGVAAAFSPNGAAMGSKDKTTSLGFASIVQLKNLKANEERQPTSTTTTATGATTATSTAITPKYSTGRRMSVGRKEPGPIMDMLLQNVEGDEIDPDKFLQKPGKQLPQQQPSPGAPNILSMRSRSQSGEDNDLVRPFNDHHHHVPVSVHSTPSTNNRKSNHRSTIMAKQAGGAIEKFNILEHQKSVAAAAQSSDDEAGVNSAAVVSAAEVVPTGGASVGSAEGSPQHPQVGGKRASFTMVAALSASANRARRATAVKTSSPLPPKEATPSPPQGLFTRIYCSVVNWFRGNKVSATETDIEGGMNENQKKLEEEEQNSFIDMYLFGKPLLFFRAVELCIMFNCLYLAFWITNFIVIDVKLDETYGWRVVGQIAMAVPIVFIIPSIGYIAETCSLLTAVSELNLEVVHAVLVETEDVTILVNELRLKMLQRISSVETADVKKMDIIHGLFSEIDKDGSGCIDHTEFRLLLKALKLTYSDQRFKRLYRAVDADGDNKIGYGEIDLLLNPPNLDDILNQNDLSGGDLDDEFDEDHSSTRDLSKQESMRRASQSSKLMDRLKHEKSAAFKQSSNVQAFKNADSKDGSGTTAVATTSSSSRAGGVGKGDSKPYADELV